MVEFVKGHGTKNDFVVLLDPSAELDLTPARVRALCDRRRGLGADGVLRAVPTHLAGEVHDQLDVAEWFMDYRNGDGSSAEMCGNGARVFSQVLMDRGLVKGDAFVLATRSGPRRGAGYRWRVCCRHGRARDPRRRCPVRGRGR